MSTRLLAIGGIGCGLLLAAIPVRAAGDPQSTEAPRPENAAGQPTPENIAAWIEALASDAYSERKAATQKLLAAGREAIAPVAHAADSDDLESPGRCIRILRRLAESSDAGTKQAAIEALRGLAGSPHVYVAREATQALLEPPAVVQAHLRARRFGPVLRGVPVLPAKIQRSLIRELTVEDEGRKVEIRYQTGENREVRVRITETIDGQEKTTEFKAANTDELREQSRVAADLFAKHTRELVRQPVQVMMNGRPVPQPGVPRGAVQLQVQTNNNGDRSILVKENDRRIQIADHAGRDIVVRITKTANGRLESIDYRARDLDELKRLHAAEAAEIYEKYTQAGHGFRVVTGRGGVQIEAVPLQPASRKAAPGNPTSPPDNEPSRD